MAAAAITAPLQTATAASPLGAVTTSAPNHVSSNGLLPLSYWYGHAEMKRNPLLMERLIRNLGENIRDRWEHDVPGMLRFLEKCSKLLFLCVLSRTVGGFDCRHSVSTRSELGAWERSSTDDDQSLRGRLS